MTPSGSIPADVRKAIEARLPTDPIDLLTLEEKSELQAALQRMARLRRHAEAESANVVMH